MRLDDVMLQEVILVFLKMAVISMIALLVLLLLLYNVPPKMPTKVVKSSLTPTHNF